MDIYILDLNDFDSKLLENLVSRDDDATLYKSKIKLNQHVAGRFLLNTVAEKVFNVEDLTIVYDDGKPVFKNSDFHFSISHSHNVIAVAVSENNVGLDVEYNLKNRDFLSLIERYDTYYANEIKNLPLEVQRRLFYEFWTKLEAKIKLNKESEIYYSTVYPYEQFTLSLACEKPFKIDKIVNYNEILII